MSFQKERESAYVKEQAPHVDDFVAVVAPAIIKFNKVEVIAAYSFNVNQLRPPDFNRIQ